MKNAFYVYRLIDPDTNIPFYVGKGIGRRMYDHERDVKRGIIPNNNKHLFHKIKKVLKKCGKIKYVKILDGVDEKTALMTESENVINIGRADLKKGPLCNLTNGGEGSTGFRHSIYHRNRLKIFNPGGKATSHVIFQLTLNGKLVKKYDSASQASKLLGYMKSSISYAANNFVSYNGFAWVYEKNFSQFKIQNLKIRTPYKCVEQKSIEGHVVKWNSIKEAVSNFNGKLSPSMITWASKNNKPYRNFYWKIYD